MAAVRQIIPFRNLSHTYKQFFNTYSTSKAHRSYHYKLVIVGGGSGGSAVANKYAKRLGVGNVAVLEPSEDHYYQPMWTLVGGGIKTFAQSRRSTESVLPKECSWLRERVTKFDPDNSKIITSDGKELTYDNLVVALGVELRYDLIKGAKEALESDPAVCSNYSPKYVTKTYPALQALRSGNAIFSFPNGPIKCAGAPQKIMYITEDYLQKYKLRDDINVIYNTALPVIFGIPKYAAALSEIVREREIILNTRHNLIEVRPQSKEAVFEKLDSPNGERIVFEYSMLHISPQCATPQVLNESPLADATGFLDVNRDTLQHKTYPNVFGIGDCTNTPTAKTAAAVAAQSGIISDTLNAVMAGKTPNAKYDGYTSCPLVTGRGKCILAEFGYDGAVLETFPLNQAKERRLMYHLKADFMPPLYWLALVKGMWHGPGIFRKIFRLGFSR